MSILIFNSTASCQVKILFSWDRGMDLSRDSKSPTGFSTRRALWDHPIPDSDCVIVANSDLALKS